MLLTTRIRSGLPSLRQARAHAPLVQALRDGAERFGFRLIEFSIQSNHVHLIVEADDGTALTRDVKGLLVRLARRLNGLWNRRGAVFVDRYHARPLKSPTEVRRALVYVLHNARRHGAFGRGIDPYSSGGSFEGFREVARAAPHARSADAGAAGRTSRTLRATCNATSWLLRIGWRLRGLIGVDERVSAWAEPRPRARDAL